MVIDTAIPVDAIEMMPNTLAEEGGDDWNSATLFNNFFYDPKIPEVNQTVMCALMG